MPLNLLNWYSLLILSTNWFAFTGFSMTCQTSTLDDNLIKAVSFCASGAFQPLAAFMGGVIAQEVIKAVSGKFTPLNQWVCSVKTFNNIFSYMLTSLRLYLL